jgi:transposase
VDSGGECVADYMTIGQVAMRFGVSVRTVKNWWLTGKTCLVVWRPHHLVGRSGISFTKKSVKEFEEKGQLKPEEWGRG